MTGAGCPSQARGLKETNKKGRWGHLTAGPVHVCLCHTVKESIKGNNLRCVRQFTAISSKIGFVVMGFWSTSKGTDAGEPSHLYSIYIYTHTHIHMIIYIYIYIYIQYTNTHTHKYIHIYIWFYIYINIYLKNDCEISIIVKSSMIILWNDHW